MAVVDIELTARWSGLYWPGRDGLLSGEWFSVFVILPLSLGFVRECRAFRVVVALDFRRQGFSCRACGFRGMSCRRFDRLDGCCPKD